MGVNLAILCQLPKLPGVLIIQGILLDLLGAGEALLGPLVARDVGRHLLVGT